MISCWPCSSSSTLDINSYMYLDCCVGWIIDREDNKTNWTPSHKEKKSPAQNTNNKNLILFAVIQWRKKKGNTSCLLQSCDSEPDPVVHHHHHPTNQTDFFFLRKKNSAQFSFDSEKRKTKIFLVKSSTLNELQLGRLRYLLNDIIVSKGGKDNQRCATTHWRFHWKIVKEVERQTS